MFSINIMKYKEYNLCCLITSILMLLLVVYKYKEIDICIIFILAAIFSIIWRSMKLIVGQQIIENDGNGNLSPNHHLTNPFFILDCAFAILAFACVVFSKQINIKFSLLAILVFIIAWTLNFMNYMDESSTIHFCGHCYVIIFMILTFYFYIR